VVSESGLAVFDVESVDNFLSPSAVLKDDLRDRLIGEVVVSVDPCADGPSDYGLVSAFYLDGKMVVRAASAAALLSPLRSQCHPRHGSRLRYLPATEGVEGRVSRQ
jgi:hypothetical protein